MSIDDEPGKKSCVCWKFQHQELLVIDPAQIWRLEAPSEAGNLATALQMLASSFGTAFSSLLIQITTSTHTDYLRSKKGIVKPKQNLLQVLWIWLACRGVTWKRNVHHEMRRDQRFRLGRRCFWESRWWWKSRRASLPPPKHDNAIHMRTESRVQICAYKIIQAYVKFQQVL